MITSEEDRNRFELLLRNFERLVKRIEAAQSEQKWFTVSEAAGLLEKSPYTIREYIKQGRLNAVKHCRDGLPDGAGGKGEWRISRDEIERFRSPQGNWPGDGEQGVAAKLNPLKPTGNGHALHGR